MTLKKDYLGTLHDVLTRPALKDFEDLGGTFFTHPQDPTKQCLYIRTHPDSKVLAVGHTDYVMFTDEPQISMDQSKIKAPQLDDRLGCWVILSLLPFNIPKDKPYDILLTDCEECGKSTGVLFNPPEGKQYNWMFQFDRRGTEVVMYDYETKDLKALVEKYGFKVGNGSFTDIAVMDQLGCAGFNVGTAYYSEHSKECHGNMPELIQQVARWKKFYSEQYDTHLIGDMVKAKQARERKTDWLYAYVKEEKKGDVVADKNSPFSWNPTQNVGTGP